MGLKSPSECITPESTVAANPLNPNFSSSLPLVQYAISPDTSSFFSLKTPTRSHATSLPIHRLTMSSIPVSSQDINTTKTLAVADPMAMHPAQSMPYLMPSYVGSTSSSKLYPDQKDVAVLTPLSSTSPPLLSTPASQPPLLPLPGSVQQHKYLTSQFTEEFDFEAMNEKFKKDEVWGYLGKANQREKIEGMEDNTTDQSMVDKEALAVVPNLDPKPAYKKDEFFDSISSNIRTQRWNGQNCFSERMKLDNLIWVIEASVLDVVTPITPHVVGEGDMVIVGGGVGILDFDAISLKRSICFCTSNLCLTSFSTADIYGLCGKGYGAMGDLFLLISSGVVNHELQEPTVFVLSFLVRPVVSVSADRSILTIIFIVIPDGLSWYEGRH
ncbi:hypothetical protein OIU76_018855 [Salix suchowensis]|nr:hypothetical protein OIU76_018855 [Salix suchowensis]